MLFEAELKYNFDIRYLNEYFRLFCVAHEIDGSDVVERFRVVSYGLLLNLNEFKRVEHMPYMGAKFVVSLFHDRFLISRGYCCKNCSEEHDEGYQRMLRDYHGQLRLF